MAGTSIAVDYLGNVLGQVDYFSGSGTLPKFTCTPFNEKPCKNENIVAMMPTSGVTTLYGLVGDILAYACIIASLALCAKFWWLVPKDETTEDYSTKKKTRKKQKKND